MKIQTLVFSVLLAGIVIPSFSEPSANMPTSPCDQIFSNALKAQPWGMNMTTYQMLTDARNSCLQKELVKQQTRIADAMNKPPQCVSNGKKDGMEYIGCSNENGPATWIGINYKTQKLFINNCVPPSNGADCWIPLPITK